MRIINTYWPGIIRQCMENKCVYVVHSIALAHKPHIRARSQSIYWVHQVRREWRAVSVNMFGHSLWLDAARARSIVCDRAQNLGMDGFTKRSIRSIMTSRSTAVTRSIRLEILMNIRLYACNVGNILILVEQKNSSKVSINLTPKKRHQHAALTCDDIHVTRSHVACLNASVLGHGCVKPTFLAECYIFAWHGMHNRMHEHRSVDRRNFQEMYLWDRQWKRLGTILCCWNMFLYIYLNTKKTEILYIRMHLHIIVSQKQQTRRT